jgi:hypothetical protein
MAAICRIDSDAGRKVEAGAGSAAVRSSRRARQAGDSRDATSPDEIRRIVSLFVSVT